MASKRKRGEVWEYTVKRAGLLPKPLYLTFASEAEGDTYCRNLESLLDKGIIPADHQPQTTVRNIAHLVREYERDAHPSDKDRSAFGPLLVKHGAVPLTAINALWVDAWIAEMKRVEKLAPATIRARVGAFARCTDWGVRKAHLVLPDNPLRTLPDGYAQYTQADKALTDGGREDVERDRRLEPGELDKLLAVIDAGVLPRKQRPYAIPHVPALRLLVVLAVETAMRLREMYTLTLDQVDLTRRTIFLDKTKNGHKRQVPLSTVALAALKTHLQNHVVDGTKMVFPWWDGDRATLVATSDFLSKLFGSITDAAGCLDLKFHDLRHTATCHLYERTTLSDIQISKITGHRSLAMLRRYANLRGSDLSSALW